MNKEEALRLLGLDLAVAPAEIERSLLERVAQLEKRAQAAPTDALKEKYRQQLRELEDARGVLVAGPAVEGLSQTMMGDLPLAHAAFTRSTGAGPLGAMGISLRLGQVLSGRYTLREQIGAGGMGAVYRAFDANRDKDIAIKVLLPQLLSSPKARERFLRESRLASEMSHPNIATVFDVQQDGVYCFLTMELLRGQNLRTYLRELRSSRKPMSVDEALRIAGQVCQALAYAHERTVHRDIKPENVWLTGEGRAKLMDFGIAMLTSGTQVEETTVAVGTPYYMAPEQLAGTGKVDARADQYAVAVMLYEMLSGQVPTGRISPLKKIRNDVPSALSAAVDRALSQRPEERFASIDEFHRALTRRALPLPPGGWKTLSLVGASAVVVGVFAMTFPQWKNLVPDREAQARAKQELGQLQAEAKSLTKFVEAQRRDVKDNLNSVARDVERTEAQLRSARSADERSSLQASWLSAKERLAMATEVERRMREQAEGAQGLTAIESEIGGADVALKDGLLPRAKEQYASAVAALEALKNVPDEARKQWTDARAKSLGQLDGKWAMNDCDDPATFIVKGELLQQFWTGMGMAEEKVVQVADSSIWTVVQSPAAQRGKFFRYTTDGSRLEVQDATTGRRASLRRCG